MMAFVVERYPPRMLYSILTSSKQADEAITNEMTCICIVCTSSVHTCIEALFQAWLRFPAGAFLNCNDRDVVRLDKPDVLADVPRRPLHRWTRRGS